MVVLTGGIASGKSAVSDRFAALGVPVIDTDRIAHEIVEPGQPVLQQVVESVGREFLSLDGHLDRRKLRSAIFSDPRLKRQLEAILHPRIAAEAKNRIFSASGPYCVVVIPLYTKSARWPWIDRVLVVDVDESTQIKRVMRRDGIGSEQAKAILSAQASRSDRLAVADDVIDNNGTIEDLRAQVETLHAKYLVLASADNGTRHQKGKFNDLA